MTRFISRLAPAVALLAALAGPARADDRAAAAAVAKAVATPLYPSSDAGFYADRGFDGEFRRMAAAVDGLAKADPSDPRLRAARVRLQEQAAANAGRLYRIARLDNLTPLGMEVMAKGLSLYLKDKPTFNDKADLAVSVLELIGNRIERYDLRTDYRAATPGLRQEAAAFADQFARFASPKAPPARYGLGVALDITDGAVTVQRVTPGGPADQAGLKAGDKLYGVNGADFGGKTLGACCDLILGGEGTDAKLVVVSPGQNARHVTAVRKLKLDLPVLDIDLNASWNRRFGGDNLHLTNRSGQRLTRCAVLVTLHDGGNTRRHLHYLDAWEPNQTWVGVYKGETDFLADEALDDVDAVTVAVLCDQFSHTQRYAYYGPEMDRDLEQYCKRLTFKLWSLDPVDNWLETKHRGVKIGFEGLGQIRPAAVTITLKDGTRSVARRWTFTGEWEDGFGYGAEVFRSDAFNGIVPTGWEMEIEFPNSSYRHRLTWGK